VCVERDFHLLGKDKTKLNIDFSCDKGRRMMSVHRFACLLLPGFLVSCSQSTQDAADAGECFVAAQSGQDFTGFHTWSNAPAAPLPGASDGGDGIHGLGPLTVYWNQSPPHGSTSFPVSTIIVKESQQADVTQRVTFAMVKRGCGYNSAGANGWEWFSLEDNADGTATILWRGLAPLAGQTYANQPAGDCNGCHQGISSNDYVWDAPLELSKF
jgi:hypothetical protein